LETEVKRAIVGRNTHCGDANAKAIEITKLKQQLATKDAEIERLKASHSDLVTDMRRQVVNLQAELAECRKPVEEVLCKDLAFFAACADQHWQYLTAKWHRNAIEGIQRERNARVAAERERGELREAWKRIRVLYRHGRKDMCYEIRIDEECLTDDDIESLLAAFAAYRAEKAKVQG
jgi:hypothetical protein